MNITISPARPFRSAWRQLAEIGACDGLDGAEYLHALGDWIKARYSGTPRLWILAWQARNAQDAIKTARDETVTLWVPALEGEA